MIDEAPAELNLVEVNTDRRLATYALNHYAESRHIMPDVSSFQIWAPYLNGFVRVAGYVRGKSPEAVVKTYLSATAIQPTKLNAAYPHSVGFNDLKSTDWWGNPATKAWLRLDQPDTALKVQDLIVEEITRRGFALVHFDNVVPPWMWAGAQSWEGQTGHVRELSRRLNALGIRTEVNSAVVPGLVTEKQWRPLVESANGATFEMPWHPQVLEHRGFVEIQIRRYRDLLAKGKSLGWYIVVPGGPIPGEPMEPWLARQDAEARFLAALAMCVREPGEFLWVGARFWRTAQDEVWSAWPELAGKAVSEWEIPDDAEPPATMERHYEYGTFEADFRARDGRFIPNDDDAAGDGDG